jgi:alcohol dehydrogenase
MKGRVAMNAFKYHVPSTIFFGSDCIKKNASLFKTYGDKAVVFAKEFVGGARNYAQEDMEEVLKEQGIQYKIVTDIQENPPVLSVKAITENIRSYNADFFIAIGGGSSIDTAKAVNILLNYPVEDNPYDVFFSGGYPDPTKVVKSSGRVPLFAVPTTAGTGAEVTGYAVLTREDTDTKLAMSQYVFCEAAFLNPNYIKAPAFLIHTGAIDALAHGVETYVNVKSNFLNRSIAEIGFQLFSEFKDNMLYDSLTDSDYEKMVLASCIQGMAFMQAGTTLPHGMGYALSHHKNVPHGLACGVFLGEYLKAFKDQSIVMPVVTKCGFNTSNEFAVYIKQICDRDIRMEVTEKELEAYAKEFCSLEVRLAKHPEPIGVNEILAIYKKALANFIK